MAPPTQSPGGEKPDEPKAAPAGADSPEPKLEAEEPKLEAEEPKLEAEEPKPKTEEFKDQVPEALPLP